MKRIWEVIDEFLCYLLNDEVLNWDIAMEIITLLCRNNLEPKKKHLEIALGQCSAGMDWIQPTPCRLLADSFHLFICHPERTWITPHWRQSGSSSGGAGGDGRGADANDSHGETSSSSPLPSPVSFSAATVGLPPPDLAALSSLRLSSPPGGRTRRVIRRGVGKMAKLSDWMGLRQSGLTLVLYFPAVHRHLQTLVMRWFLRNFS
jgi:hypothetical protein